MMEWFIRAFKRRGDVELITIGPFFGDWIPWGFGMRLPQKYVHPPDIPLPQSMAQFPGVPSVLQNFLPWFPDLWLQIDAGWHLSSRPSAGIVGLVETDPHVLKASYKVPKAYSDRVWCMQTPYIEEGEIYLPYAYDPTVHFPEERDKIYDACLIGLHYETRTRLVERLKSRGLNVYYSLGDIYDEYREKYNQSKVALSWSSLLDLPARNWEALAMRLPLVCNHVPDMSRFFENGVHYLGFSTLEEAEGQVLRLLTDDDFRECIAQAGYRKVSEDGKHTWDARVSQILKDCELI